MSEAVRIGDPVVGIERQGDDARNGKPVIEVLSLDCFSALHKLHNDVARHARKSRIGQRRAPVFRPHAGEAQGLAPFEQAIQDFAEGSGVLAEKEREIILAEAYKISQTNMGEGDAKAFRIYAQAYQKDVEFFEFMRTMEAYKKALDKETSLVLSRDSEFLKYLK